MHDQLPEVAEDALLEAEHALLKEARLLVAIRLLPLREVAVLSVFGGPASRHDGRGGSAAAAGLCGASSASRARDN